MINFHKQLTAFAQCSPLLDNFIDCTRSFKHHGPWSVRRGNLFFHMERSRRAPVCLSDLCLRHEVLRDRIEDHHMATKRNERQLASAPTPSYSYKHNRVLILDLRNLHFSHVYSAGPRFSHLTRPCRDNNRQVQRLVAERRWAPWCVHSLLIPGSLCSSLS